MDQRSIEKSAASGISRPWILVVVIVFSVWFMLTVLSSKPSAIRPEDGTVVDSQLQPRLELLANIVDALPGETRPREELGEAYESNELHQLAAATWRQLVSQEPGSWVWPYRLAMALERQGDLEAAILWMNRSVEHSPPDVLESRWRLAHWLIDVGRLEEASVPLLICVQMDPEALPVQVAQARLALARGDAHKAEQLIHQFDLTSNLTGGYGWHLLARALRRQGRLEEAHQAWLQVDHVRPRYQDRFNDQTAPLVGGLRVLRQAAEAQTDQGLWKDVLQTTSRILNIKPGDRTARKLQAMARLELGELAMAESQLSSLMLEVPDASILSSLARARLMLYRIDDDVDLLRNALQAIAAGLKLDPENYDLLLLQRQAESLLDHSGDTVDAE